MYVYAKHSGIKSTSNYSAANGLTGWSNVWQTKILLLLNSDPNPKHHSPTRQKRLTQ